MNMAVIPLSQQFHPVYIAAAYLAWIKHSLSTQLQQTKRGLAPILLPDSIGGHPWYLYVDAAIDLAQL